MEKERDTPVTNFLTNNTWLNIVQRTPQRGMYMPRFVCFYSLFFTKTLSAISPPSSTPINHK
jgi:hypothetical protein